MNVAAVHDFAKSLQVLAEAVDVRLYVAIETEFEAQGLKLFNSLCTQREISIIVAVPESSGKDDISLMHGCKC